MALSNSVPTPANGQRRLSRGLVQLWPTGVSSRTNITEGRRMRLRNEQALSLRSRHRGFEDTRIAEIVDHRRVQPTSSARNIDLHPDIVALRDTPRRMLAVLPQSTPMTRAMAHLLCVDPSAVFASSGEWRPVGPGFPCLETAPHDASNPDRICTVFRRFAVRLNGFNRGGLRDNPYSLIFEPCLL